MFSDQSYSSVELPGDFPSLVSGIEANYRFTVPNYEVLTLKENKVYFLPLASMKSGQHEVAFLKVVEKVELLKQRHQRFDHKKAYFSEDESGQVILLKDCILLIDGNHKSLASLWLGAETFPVEVLHDWRTRSFAEALPDLKKQHLIWPYKKGELILEPSPLNELTHNPLRFWISQALGKVKIKQTKKADVKINKKRELEHPIAVKIGRDFPFFEFILALALESQNFEPSNEDEPNLVDTIQARELLKQALTDENFPERRRLRQMFLLWDSESYQDNAELEKLLARFLVDRDCLPLLNPNETF